MARIPATKLFGCHVNILSIQVAVSAVFSEGFVMTGMGDCDMREFRRFNEFSLFLIIFHS